MIDYFAKDKFKSKDKFVSYAVKKTLCEMMLEEFHEKSGIEGKEFPGEEEIQRLHTEIKEIRRSFRVKRNGYTGWDLKSVRLTIN